MAGIVAGAATVLGVGAAMTATARSSKDPSFSNAVSRAASKAAWPMIVVAGGWHLSMSGCNVSPADVLQSPRGLLDAAVLFTVLYAVGGLVSRTIYSVACVPPGPSDPHADEDALFCRRSDEVKAVVWPICTVAILVHRVRRLAALFSPASE